MVKRSISHHRSLSMPTALLALLAVGAAGLNWFALDYTIDSNPIAVPHRNADTATAGATILPLARKPATSLDYTETVSRPLFNPNRRPIVQAEIPLAPRAEAATLQPLQVQLLGLATTGAKNRRALVKPMTERHGVWISIGEDFGGWRLSEIGSDHAVFEAGADRQVLQLAKHDK